MCVDVWRRICRRLHNPTSNKEKREVLGPYRLAVAKIAAGVPLQVGVGWVRSSGLVRLCWFFPACLYCLLTPLLASLLALITNHNPRINPHKPTTFQPRTHPPNAQLADAVINYVITYDSQIEPVVNALKSMPKLAFDALVYALLQRCGR